MKRILMTVGLAMGFAFGFWVGFEAAPDQAIGSEIKWKLQSVWPSGSLGYDGLTLRFCDNIAKKTQGRLKITPFPPDALAKVMETYDAVAAGAVELAFSTGLYHARKIPEALVEFGLPFSFTGPPFKHTAHDQTYEFFYKFRGGEALKILREAYGKRGTYLIGVGPSASYGFMTKFPVSSLADFKGKKIRSFGSFSALLQKVGAAPVSIPGAEQYLALQRGTIDGTLFPYYVLETYKLKEVISSVVVPPILAAPIVEFYVNLKTWQALPDDLKKIVEETLVEDFKWYSQEAVKLDEDSMEKAKKAGVKLVALSEADTNTLRAFSMPLWDEAASKSEASARLVNLVKEYLKEKGHKF